MIRSFRSADTNLLWETGTTRRPPASINAPALRKLALLHWATSLLDLKIPPGNRLEALKGDRKGQHSIRINGQYRICFVWRGNDAHDVEIVDYH